MSDHADYREWAAAYVLGALEPGEVRRFEAHLDECELCRRDVAEFAPIPALLARIQSPEQAVMPDGVTRRARSRIRAEHAALVRSRQRWRWVAVSAALVAVAAIVTLAGAALSGSDAPEAMAMVVDAEAVPAQISVSPRAWGSAIDLRLEELPPLDLYVAWAVDRDGTWQQVAAWGPTPGGRAVVSASSSFTTAELAGVVVTSGDRATTLVTAHPADG